MNEKFSTTPSARFPPAEPELPENEDNTITATTTANLAAHNPPNHIFLRRRSSDAFLAAAADRLLVELLAIFYSPDTLKDLQKTWNFGHTLRRCCLDRSDTSMWPSGELCRRQSDVGETYRASGRGEQGRLTRQALEPVLEGSETPDHPGQPR